ncbi:tyrosine-protein phosphatase [bacterium]|nr:tyrosine-protein phosphatase [bacterium]
MKLRHWTQGLLTAAMAVSLVGCGMASPQQGGALSGASSNRVVAESVPSAAALERLAAASPDRLIDNAPLEPGAEGIWPKPPAEDLGNLGKLEPNLWRGARPTEKGMDMLLAMGCKTIVNFENDKKVVAQEKAWAEARGIKFVSIPLSIITPPKLENINKFLTLANDPSARPLYFHCMQGRDRTGTAAFAYRISHDGWSYDKAYEEMKAYKFHTYLLGLRGFLVWYAKTQAPAAALAQ